MLQHGMFYATYNSEHRQGTHCSPVMCDHHGKSVGCWNKQKLIPSISCLTKKCWWQALETLPC